MPAATFSPWSDTFDGRQLDEARWVGGYCNDVDEARVWIDDGLHLEFVRGSQYVSAGVLTRAPIVGDFVATVRFSTSNPGQGTTLELAAIAIDGPRHTQLDQSKATVYDRSRVFDVHGAPPYVSSEFDEADGARIGWNRGPALTESRLIQGPRGQDIVSIADNHFNRYGPSAWPVKPIAGLTEGFLALARQGDDWSAWHRLPGESQWRLSGDVRAMNLPGPVFLRLAAKHWPKDGATARGTHVVFRAFECGQARPGAVPLAEPQAARLAGPVAAPDPWPGRSAPPEEVAIVQEVRGCTDCKWFAAESRYGGFIHIRPADAEPAGGDAARKVVVDSVSRPEPDALIGCRKAPIMLIGINPNLPGGWLAPKASSARKPSSRDPSGTPPRRRPDGATGSWALRHAARTDEDYARLHRRAPDARWWAASSRDIESTVAADITMLVASAPGRLAETAPRGADFDPRQHSRRAVDARSLHLVVAQQDGGTVQHDRTWQAQDQLVVVRERFAAGQAIAGVASQASAAGKAIDAQPAAPDSYYLNADLVLQALGRRLGSPKPLRLGEDLSLHDAVACASPGWSGWKIPAETKSNCVDRRGWLHRQIVQSQPRVLLVASQTALNLLRSDRHGRLSEEPPSGLAAGGRDGLNAWVHTQRLSWIPQGGAAPMRVVLCSHLSYGDNLEPQAHFTAEQWASFSRRFPAAVEHLRGARRVTDEEAARGKAPGDKLAGKPGDPGYEPQVVVIPIRSPEAPGPDEPLWKALQGFGPESWDAGDPAGLRPNAAEAMKDRWLDPLDEVALHLETAALEQGVRWDQSQAALERAPGDCAYCDNPWWTIEGGCAYAKA